MALKHDPDFRRKLEEQAMREAHIDMSRARVNSGYIERIYGAGWHVRQDDGTIIPVPAPDLPVLRHLTDDESRAAAEGAFPRMQINFLGRHKTAHEVGDDGSLSITNMDSPSITNMLRTGLDAIERQMLTTPPTYTQLDPQEEPDAMASKLDAADRCVVFIAHPPTTEYPTGRTTVLYGAYDSLDLDTGRGYHLAGAHGSQVATHATIKLHQVTSEVIPGAITDQGAKTAYGDEVARQQALQVELAREAAADAERVRRQEKIRKARSEFDLDDAA